MHRAADSMMAVLQEASEDESCVHSETLHYEFLLLSKIALNTVVLSSWLRSVNKSLIGIWALSAYVADVLMVGAITWVWWFHTSFDHSKAVCLLLSHGATVYSFIALPALLLGAVDYASHQRMGVYVDSPKRMAVNCLIVLLLWALAGLYSYVYTNPTPLTILLMNGSQVQACPVKESLVVSFFTVNLTIVVLLVLLVYALKIPRWLRLASKLSSKRNSLATKSDLAFSSKEAKLEDGTAEETLDDDGQDRPPLSVSLILCFATNWLPYLVISVACDLGGLAVPAYATVNLLWVGCANSLLAGICFWHSSRTHGPFHKLPDDICSWSNYWYLSKQDCPLVVDKNNLDVRPT